MVFAACLWALLNTIQLRCVLATNLNILVVTCFNIRNSSSEQKYIENLIKLIFFKSTTLHLNFTWKKDEHIGHCRSLKNWYNIHKIKCSHLQHITPLQNFSCCFPIITLPTFLCLFTLRWCLRTIYSLFPKEGKPKMQCNILEVTETHWLFLEINSGVSVCTSLFLKAKVPLDSNQVDRF